MSLLFTSPKLFWGKIHNKWAIFASALQGPVFLKCLNLGPCPTQQPKTICGKRFLLGRGSNHYFSINHKTRQVIVEMEIRNYTTATQDLIKVSKSSGKVPGS